MNTKDKKFSKSPKKYNDRPRRDFKPREEQPHEDLTDSGVVAGRNAVRELLKSGRDIDKIFTQAGEREGSITVLASEPISRGIQEVEVE